MSIRATAGSSFKISSDASCHSITFNEEDRRYPNIIPSRSSCFIDNEEAHVCYNEQPLSLFFI